MSSYVYMKVLESMPRRYDRGIGLLSRETIGLVYQRVADLAAGPEKHVLDLGCGTGSLTMACAAKGATAVGIDSNAGMLEIARRKAAGYHGCGSIEFVALDVMELEDRFGAQSFDAAISCLLFSELTPEERRYVLKTLRQLIKPGGILVIAEEVIPRKTASRIWWRLKRAPLAALTWLLTQTTTSAVDDLETSIEAAGFSEVKSEHLAVDFMVVEATC